MSVKMMPPKKSKAARSDNLETVVEKPAEPKPEEVVSSEPEDEPLPGVEPKEKPFNIFDITTVEGKRKRSVSTPESSISDWVLEHFEEKAGIRLPLGEVYNIYLEKCVNEASTAVEPVVFNRVMREKFPEGFTFNPKSPFADRVKEKKVKKKETKVKADTLTLKIRDIIQNSLKDMGNPKGGVRFSKLLGYVAGKYPALRIELRPKMLLAALQRGVRFGYLVCERGIGKCGFYRVFVDDEMVEPKKKDQQVKDKEDTDKDGESPEGEKSADESADDGNEKNDKKKDNDKDESKDKEDKKPVKKKARPAPKERFIHHGNPARIEDTFYLAMTFMSEPKEASVIRIKKYVAEHYPEKNIDRLGRCLDAGKEKGYWEQISGTSGNLGKFRLEVDSFDPTDDEDMTGMVINAITACTEPKMCSAPLLKKYVLEWYADKFKVAERPQLFKKALERAATNQEIRQLSGIGASGTFQLVKPFTPSPLVLAGQDTASDYDEEDEESSEEEAIETYDYTNYGDKYKPRPSKRRGMARTKAVHAKPAVEINEEIIAKRKRKAARRAVQKNKKRRRDDSDSDESSSESSEDSSSEESSEEEEEVPVKKRAAPKGRTPAAKKQAAPPPKKAPAKRVTKAANKPKPESRGRNRPRPSYAEDESGDDSDDSRVVDGYRPTPSKSRGGTQARKTTTPVPAKKKTPTKKTKPVDKTPPRVRTPAAKKQGDRNHYPSDSDDSIDSDRPTGRVETLAAKKQRSSVAPKSRGRRR